MNAHRANVIIHVGESLSDPDIYDMEHKLSGVDGVVSACVHKRTRHLWVIDYDPREVNSNQLLRRVRGSGLDARLIGGI